MEQKLAPAAKLWAEPAHPRSLINRAPTPQDLLELSARIYKSSRRLYNEADSQGMRVYHDERVAGDVRVVMLVPAWFPKAHVQFDWARVADEAVSVVLVVRGTMQDLVGNTKANLQLIWNKLVDEQHLPDVAADATKVMQAWLLELLRRHPQLDAGVGGGAEGSQAGASSNSGGGGGAAGSLRLDVHVTGHSLGGLLAEVATVESRGFAAAHGAGWRCTSFESPGLPDFYHACALRMAPAEAWDDCITGYVAAPNCINMLNRHLGSVVHVVVPWEQTWSHVAKCVGADVARVTAWAIIGLAAYEGSRQLAALTRRRDDEDEQPPSSRPRLAAPVALSAALPEPQPQPPAPAPTPGVLDLQQCSASLPGAAPAAAADVLTVAATGAGSRTLAAVMRPGASGAPLPPAPAASGGQNLAAAAVGAAAAAGEAAASMGGTRIIQAFVKRSGLGVLVSAVSALVWGKGGLWGVMECLAGVLGVEVEELIAQHSLGPMRQCFDPHSGQLKPRFARRMASWPCLGSRGQVMLTAAKQVAKWTLPSFVCRENVGVANVLSRTAMVEARCARLEGYVVLADPDGSELAQMLPGDAAALPLGQPLLAAAAPSAARHARRRSDSSEAAAVEEGRATMELELFAGQQQQAEAATGAVALALGAALGRRSLREPAPGSGACGGSSTSSARRVPAGLGGGGLATGRSSGARAAPCVAAAAAAVGGNVMQLDVPPAGLQALLGLAAAAEAAEQGEGLPGEGLGVLVELQAAAEAEAGAVGAAADAELGPGRRPGQRAHGLGSGYQLCGS